jgi:hypothetical protein
MLKKYYVNGVGYLKSAGQKVPIGGGRSPADLGFVYPIEEND